MENISYIGLSQQLALQQQMEMTANNLANMSTPGYKAQHTLFSEYITDPDDGVAIHQSSNSGSYRDLSNGSLTQTHNPFDVAMQAEGFFAIRGTTGVSYTRDGSFSLNSERQLVNKAGFPVLNGNDEAISVPADATQIRITEDGEITSENGTIGRLKVVEFADKQALTRLGNNMFDAQGQAEIVIDQPRMVQGAIENSNVNPVIEMNRMIEVLRNYQSTQRMLQTDHERIRNAVQKLTSV